MEYDDDEGDSNPVDYARVFTFLFLLVVLVAVALGTYYFFQARSEETFRTACTTNPTERYAVSCSSYDACVVACMKRLAHGS